MSRESILLTTWLNSWDPGAIRKNSCTEGVDVKVLELFWDSAGLVCNTSDTPGDGYIRGS